ncbi:hypothetical protein FQN54_002746 [Arachnomyces sp. PD_36]|nr:hypothetical protein FQN54_002746 [Arachnomyces sp. PD_36]
MPLPTPSTIKSLSPTLLISTSVLASLILGRLVLNLSSSSNSNRKQKEKKYARTVIFGTFIQLPASPESDKGHKLSVTHGALWVSASDGRIQGFDWKVRDEGDLKELLRRNGWIDVDGSSGSGDGERGVRIVRNEKKNGFFFPGFIDTHIHASQYPNSGIFGSSTLLDWLETYTFPLEASYRSDKSSKDAPSVARSAYEKVISRTLSHGTTCAAYFATIHVPATNLLANICHSRGQRAFIGRLCMDNPDFCPDYYCDASAEESITATEETISHIRKLDPQGKLVAPIITPRFAPTCTSTALSKLGALAASSSPPLHIQTHISENKNEIQLVQELFPTSKSYADVYDKAGLLTPKTILAHGVHLSQDERDLIRSRSAKISHCPVSNTAIGSGLCPVRDLLNCGITVGLGTDVSGGYSSSVLEAARHTCLISRLVAYQGSAADPAHPAPGYEKIGVEESLYLATRGGAQVVGKEKEIGGFEVGMFWDAQMIDLGGTIDEGGECMNDIDIFGWESWEEKIAKWVWNGDDRNVRKVWVAGRLVHERE